MRDVMGTWALFNDFIISNPTLYTIGGRKRIKRAAQQSYELECIHCLFYVKTKGLSSNRKESLTLDIMIQLEIQRIRCVGVN